jgi:lipid A ethanolaminephosphotransferase
MSTTKPALKRSSLSRTQFLLLTALWISILPNLATLGNFVDSPAAGTGISFIFFVLGGWVVTYSVVLLFLTLFGVLFPGPTIKWWCGIATILASVLGYHSIFLGTLFESTMFANIIQTHAAEALELIGVRVATWVALVGVVPAVVLLWLRLTPYPSWARAAMRTLALLTLPILASGAAAYSQFQNYASAARNRSITFHTLAPANIVAAGATHWYSLHRKTIVREPVGLDARVQSKLAKPRLVVFVLGETARAQNQTLNGYTRATNDRMIAEKVINFPNTESCGTATAISLPCLFSGYTREEFSLAKGLSRETLMDLVQRAGTKSLWRDNDSGCKGACDRIENEDFTNSTNPRWCTAGSECFDEILLEGLEDRLRKETGDVFLVLHLKGSHGPAYFKRYPKAFERFTPACQSVELSACEPKLLVNAYDNTIVYTDHVLGEIVNLLKKMSPDYATMMLYASDHGESLGERGLYLHGMPYAIAPEEQTRVPMWAWFSDQYLKLEGMSDACVRGKSLPGMKHDHIYSTLLGLLHISAKEHNPALDIFSACRSASPK